MNHPFVDSNKRLAFGLTAVFLNLNGYTLRVTAKDGLHFIKQRLIEERADLPAITA